MTSDDANRRIRRRIRLAEQKLLDRGSIGERRNLMGSLLFTISSLGMLGFGWLYWTDRIGAVTCILVNAFLASILHEIEHDLIHKLYFGGRSRVERLAHHSLMLFVWLFRGNVIHGWFRRRMHLEHHRLSGTEGDIEERLLGLGMPMSLRRLLIMIDGSMAYFLGARALEKELPHFNRRSLLWASLPVYPVFACVLWAFLLMHGFRLVSGSFPSGAELWLPWIELLAVAWVFPNYLRQAALQIVSSNVHYFADVPNLRGETQVLRPLFFWPLQLFCFNFGTTHIFHHFVPDQPFYIRQWITPVVLPTLRACGVRFNDIGTFWRANRFRPAN